MHISFFIKLIDRRKDEIILYFVDGWCPLLPAGCPGIEEVAMGIAGICPLRFFGQRARRALDFKRAGGQNGHGHARAHHYQSHWDDVYVIFDMFWVHSSDA